MYNVEKSKRYINLISKVKKSFSGEPSNDHRDSNGNIRVKKLSNSKVKLNWCDECNEINVWTYWQGRYYADTTPDINIMVVGQDWGNLGEAQNTLAYIHTDDNKFEHKYFTNNNRKFDSDENLIEIFKDEKVFNQKYKDIDTRFYPDLFFTNFCLGYREGKSSSGMSIGLMREDEIYFKELVDIVQPKIIICLGRLCYEAACKALTGKNPKISNGFNAFLDNENIGIKVGNTTIYASAHVGKLGINNRCHGNKEIIIKDWAKFK